MRGPRACHRGWQVGNKPCAALTSGFGQKNAAACVPFFSELRSRPRLPHPQKNPPGAIFRPASWPFQAFNRRRGPTGGVPKTLKISRTWTPKGPNPHPGVFFSGFWTKKRGRLRALFSELRSRPRLPHPQKNTPGAIFRPASWPFQAFNRRRGPAAGVPKTPKISRTWTHNRPNPRRRRLRRPPILGGVPFLGTNSKIQQCTDIFKKQPKPQMPKKPRNRPRMRQTTLAKRACACAEAQAVPRRRAQRRRDGQERSLRDVRPEA